MDGGLKSGGWEVGKRRPSDAASKKPPIVLGLEKEKKVSQILPFLYIGDEDVAADVAALTALKTKYILNTSDDVENAFPETDIVYMNVKVADWEYEDIVQHFPKVFAFIDNAQEKRDGTVLVHCTGGVSRSSAFVIAYLMHFSKLTLREAYNRVKSMRPAIEPNEGFAKQLIDYELSLGRGPSMVLNDFVFSEGE